MPATWLERLIVLLSEQFPPGSQLHFAFNIRALIAVVLVSLVCGMVGSLVVGNRMAFFSDALAHCAIAGVTLGFLIGIALRLAAASSEAFVHYQLPGIMVGFGIAIGLAIAFVRERTALASDTVIGVFFAGAIGFGAIFSKTLSARGYGYSLEWFMFGDPATATAADLLLLLVLAVLTAALLAVLYNQMVFASFNPSLARSRNVRVRLCGYLFIALLALIVNLSIRTVGALLINAMLIVPAATASLLARNLRQLFWLTIGLSLAVAVVGQWLSWEVRIPDPNHPDPLSFGIGGTVVVLSVLVFFAAMALGPLLRGRQAA